MSGNYIFPSQKALICRWVAAFFAAAAALAVAVPIGLLVVTGDPLISWECNSASECGFRDGSLEALDEDERKQVLATPGAERTYAEHVGRGPIRFGLAAVAIASQLPFAVLLGAVAMALFGFGRGSGLGGALRWMRIVALTALVMAIWPSIIGLLRSALLLPGTPYGPGYIIEVEAGPLFLHLMLAFATLAMVWALDAGHQAQRDLAEIV